MNDCERQSDCGGRRDFLVKATALAGGLVLSLSGVDGIAQDKKDKKDKAMKMDNSADETVLKLGADSPLAKVGGTQTVETKTGKIIVLRTGAEEFKAFTAVCPHKGGPIKYDEKTSQLFCPWHNSRFDTSGKVFKGPSKKDLPSLPTQEAVVVSITPQA